MGLQASLGSCSGDCGGDCTLLSSWALLILLGGESGQNVIVICGVVCLVLLFVLFAYVFVRESGQQ